MSSAQPGWFRRRLKRMFCRHDHWREALLPQKRPHWHQREWVCVACGKRVLYPSAHPPLGAMNGFYELENGPKTPR